MLYYKHKYSVNTWIKRVLFVQGQTFSLSSCGKFTLKRISGHTPLKIVSWRLKDNACESIIMYGIYTSFSCFGLLPWIVLST